MIICSPFSVQSTTIGCIEHSKTFLPKIKNQEFTIQLFGTIAQWFYVALVLDPRLYVDGKRDCDGNPTNH